MRRSCLWTKRAPSMDDNQAVSRREFIACGLTVAAGNLGYTEGEVERKRGMTEAEWLTCANLDQMLRFLTRRAGHLDLESCRKFSLFACACCRRVVRDKELLDAIDLAERGADGLAAQSESTVKSTMLAGIDEQAANGMDRKRVWAVETTLGSIGFWPNISPITNAIGYARAASTAPVTEKQEQAALLREIGGNPFRPFALPASLPTDIVMLVEEVYCGMPRRSHLASALRSADLHELADHFSSGHHPKGCWALDLILGKPAILSKPNRDGEPV